MPTTLARAAPALSAGVAGAADGARDLEKGGARLATGARDLAAGAATVSSGTASAATGARRLAEGGSSLEGGAEELHDGARDLVGGLDRITRQVPDYDARQRASVAAVAADPVQTTTSAGTTADGALAYLGALAMAVGALVLHLLLAAVPHDALTSRRGALRLAASAAAPGVLVAAAQAVLVAGVLQAALDLGLARSCAVGGVAFLGGLALNAVNQALVAWLGGAGRLVSLAAVALGAPAALVSTVPPSLGRIAAATPVRPVTDALRHVVVTGGLPGGSVAGARRLAPGRAARHHPRRRSSTRRPLPPGWCPAEPVVVRSRRPDRPVDFRRDYVYRPT